MKRQLSGLAGVAIGALLFRLGGARSLFDAGLALLAAAIGAAIAVGAVRRRSFRVAVALAAGGAGVLWSLTLHEALRGERRDEGPPPGTFPALRTPHELHDAVVVAADDDEVTVRATGLAPTFRWAADAPANAPRPPTRLENGVPYRPDAPPRARPWRFAVWADSRGGTDAFRRLRTEIAARDVAFSVGVGDLVGMARRYQFEILRDQLADTGTPAFFVPGNHDVDPFGSTWPFERVFGPTRWTFDEDGVRFVGLDSSHGHVDEAQVAWAEGLLANRPAALGGVVVFCHYPIYPPTGRPDKPLPQDEAATKRLHAALSAAKATCFCGSYHAFDRTEHEGVVQFVSGGAGSKPEGPGGHHLLVATVSGTAAAGAAGVRIDVEKVDVMDPRDASPALDRLMVFRDEAAWTARAWPLRFAVGWMLAAVALGGLGAAVVPRARPVPASLPLQAPDRPA